jgi:hypothetical protein
MLHLPMFEICVTICFLRASNSKGAFGRAVVVAVAVPVVTVLVE